MSTTLQTVFITGASSGIGLATAKYFHAQGWNVAATMRTPSKCKELTELDSPRMFVTRLDLEEYDSIKHAIDAVIAKFGVIDVLINNAGYAQRGLFEAISRETVQKQFNVNLFGVMDVTRLLLPHFRANGHGGVINISSGAGFVCMGTITMYNSSKFALEGFGEALSYELASQNIFVKTVVPHGGVSGTEFGTRSRSEMAVPRGTLGGGPDGQGEELTSYEGFTKQLQAVFAGMNGGIVTSSEDVAKVIWGAATDGTTKYRYFVGPERDEWIAARYESNSDEEYMAKMRAFLT
ncbi:short-chain dehydrogenase reductase SDR [Coniophora puteana RWD-64-598 SS2]|uniref:Short-chain dehydrogenase reductase SDR n=1 Tax=Coniophora puteana (strain RWD-64-598) TaxID=741705 RepID=A0A5M3MG08_CONPW|nr:short-chain dehydrogenase reductase SDR [Coniophora puteana RWD-64-598 SS2]EIW77977.1 short-chain dehydrogenase reductase SDR [Coniophora puteana RWD-64-598 SS2]